MIKNIVFDWGDTIMRDYNEEGPMWKWKKVDWIPGAEDMLKHCSERYKCIIATSADHSGTEDMIKALERVGANKYFDHFFSQKELGYKKPDPRFFKSILEKLSLDADETVMVGNFYEKDIIGAKKSNMFTILFDEQKQQKDFPHADAVIHSFSQFQKALNHIV